MEKVQLPECGGTETGGGPATIRPGDPGNAAGGASSATPHPTGGHRVGGPVATRAGAGRDPVDAGRAAATFAAFALNEHGVPPEHGHASKS